MKKIFFALAVVATIISCEHRNPADDPGKSVTDTIPQDTIPLFAKVTLFEALGTNTVPSESYTKDSVRVEARLKGDTAVDICLYQVRFSSRMPVTIDMVIPDVPCVRTMDRITFAGEDINPTMGGNPVSRYVITGLTGFITADSLVFSNNYGSYQDCSYAGSITDMQ